MVVVFYFMMGSITGLGNTKRQVKQATKFKMNSFAER
jgi:hypothetical protein